MSDIWIQTAFKPLKTYLPHWISDPIRSVATALLTPMLFSYRTGHLRSSFKRIAVSRSGDPLPWYTYPCIDFLKYRSYEDKTVLEFGTGQSTLWWAQRAKNVVGFEGDEVWHHKLKASVPSNVELHPIPIDRASKCVEEINRILGVQPGLLFDVIVIDGPWRYQMIEISAKAVTDTGIIICDNAEGYGFCEGFRSRDFLRVDFFGYAPGVVLPHSTSIFFRPGSFVFDPKHPIPDIAKEP